jgi:radical SAM superfamily enzyme YgiQ (UPF0313 family)
MKKAVFIDLLNLFWDQHGVYSLAAALKRNNIDVRFFGTRSSKKALAYIKEIKPDILLYSTFSATIPRYIEFDRIVKKDMPVVSLMGGSGPTYDPKCMDGSTIDAICIGEGESAVVDFINNGFTGSKNIFRNGDSFPSEFSPLADLDGLPFPDRSIIYNGDSLLRTMPSKQFLSGRGCPFHCTYCFNHKFNELFKGYGKLIRKKSVDYLLEEIKLVRRDYPLQNIVFQDDTFILDKRWFFEFCERFPKEIGLTYTCNIRANLIDEDIVKGLRDSNCRGVNWSIESGNDFMRNEVLKRNMSKEQILTASELLGKYKIQHRIGNVIGLPGETFEQIFETVEMNIKSKPHLALANIFVPFPGLELTKYAKENGYYEERSQNGLPKDFFTQSVLNFSKQQNKAICKLVYLFPVFVSKPYLFRNIKIRNLLMGLPRFLLRVFYEILYAWRMSKMYVVKTPFWCKFQMGIRYLKNL